MSALTARKTRLRLKLHPLFLLFGAYYAFTGRLFLFLMSTVVALEHECAHAFMAERLGYRLNRIVLMPYGAVIDGDLSGVSLRDEILVAAAGPFINFVTAAAFFALWWLYPETYAYTDTACYVSLAVALCNLLPSYPLDGGRILRAALSKSLAPKIVKRICLAVSLAVALCLSVLFVLSCVHGTPQISLLVFTAFTAVGAFGNGKRERTGYAKIDFSSKAAFLRGVSVRRVAVTQNCSLKRAVSFVNSSDYLILELYDDEENFVTELSQNELAGIFYSSSDIYAPLKDCL